MTRELRGGRDGEERIGAIFLGGVPHYVRAETEVDRLPNQLMLPRKSEKIGHGFVLQAPPSSAIAKAYYPGLRFFDHVFVTSLFIV